MGPGSLDQCPCCGFRTGCVTCPICFWTDVTRAQPGAVMLDANITSLSEARLNYAIYGASHQRYLDFVRAPRPDEAPDWSGQYG